MTVQEIVKSIIRVTGNTQVSIAKKLGMAGQSNISMLLQSKSMRVDNMLKVLNACGYEVIARDPGGKYPEYRFGDVQSTSDSIADKQNDPALMELVRKMVAEELRKGTDTGVEETDEGVPEEGEKPE